MALKIENVSYAYRDGVQALCDVDFELPEKCFLAILGESGSGKTTLLKTIAGLLDPQKGRIIINGDDVTELTTASRDLTMVFQNFALYPFMSVYENVYTALNGFPLGEDEKDRRVKDILLKFGLGHYLNFKPRNLSEGQKQRVAIARAFVREPSLFLLDEPFSNLDLPQKRKLLRELKSIYSSSNCTFLYVTHDAAEAKTYGDQVLLLDKGRLLQIGAPAEILSRPQSLKAARLLYSGEVNEIPVDGYFRDLKSDKGLVVTGEKEGVFAVPYRSFAIQENGPFKVNWTP